MVTIECRISTGRDITLVDSEAAEESASEHLRELYDAGISPRRGETVKLDHIEIEEAGFFVAEIDSITYATDGDDIFIQVLLMAGY